MALKTNAIAAQLGQARGRIERQERQLEISRMRASQAKENFNDLVNAIHSDSYAMSFQSFGQYRRALLTLATEIEMSHSI